MLRLEGHVISRAFVQAVFVPQQPRDPELESILMPGRRGNQNKWLAIFNLHDASSGNITLLYHIAILFGAELLFSRLISKNLKIKIYIEL